MPIIRTCKALLFDPNGRVLVLRVRESPRHPYHNSRFDLPGGMVDPYESEAAALVREVAEETGMYLEISALRLMYASTRTHHEKKLSFIKLVYVAKLGYVPDVNLSWEHDGYEWVDFQTILETHPFRPFYRDAISYILQNGLHTEP